MRISDWSSDVCSSDLQFHSLFCAVHHCYRGTVWRKRGHDCLSTPVTAPVGEADGTGGCRAELRRPCNGPLWGWVASTRDVRSQSRPKPCRTQRPYYPLAAPRPGVWGDRESVVYGKSVARRVDLCGLPLIQNNN